MKVKSSRTVITCALSLTVLIALLCAVRWHTPTLKAAEPDEQTTPYLDADQYALLDEMLDIHLNYFLASGPITSHGLLTRQLSH